MSRTFLWAIVIAFAIWTLRDVATKAIERMPTHPSCPPCPECEGTTHA